MMRKNFKEQDGLASKLGKAVAMQNIIQGLKLIAFTCIDNSIVLLVLQRRLLQNFIFLG